MDFKYSYTENCIFKGVCPRENRIGCDENCYIQPEIYYLLNTSNIPKQYIKKTFLSPNSKDIDTFKTLKEIFNDIEVFVSEGRSLYLWSENTGNGKTEFACKLLKGYLASICIGNGFSDRGFFEYVPSFVLLSRDFKNPERKEHIEALLKRDLVVLDDIGSIKSTEYDITVLLDIINTRYSNGLSTIYTSNISPNDLFKGNVRLTDRICSDIVLEIKGGSRRKLVSNYKRKDIT